MIYYPIAIIAGILFGVLIDRLFWENKEPTKVEQEDKVKCNECKCWLSKADAQTVEFLSTGISFGYSYHYYCKSHRKPYTRLLLSSLDRIYFKEIEVDEKGEPIGYKKIK